MTENIFIPKKCKVGFNERSDTYTGMLGYVIYFDGKKWRKEPSWEGWRYKYISSEEAERQKLDAYNNQISYLFERSKNSNGKLVRQWVDGKNVTIDDIKTEEDIMKVVTLETFRHHMGNSSSNPKIKPIEFENEPLEGFVLNKKSGGGSSGWNSRQTYCRVYDPRGFEFEISIPNLLYILENANSIKGKGLDGKFIYGWSGKDLVLVPEDAPEFKDMVKFTKLQDGKVYKRDLVKGNIYMNSSGQKLTYLGEAYQLDYSGYLRSKKKKLWFAVDSRDYYVTYTSVQPLKGDTGTTDPDFAGTMDKVEKHDKYYPGEIEHEKIENPIEYLKAQFPADQDGYSYNNTKGLFFKRTSDGELIEMSVYKTTDYVGGYRFGNQPSGHRETEVVYKIGTGGHRIDETFKELDHITNKYELWQLKMTK